MRGKIYKIVHSQSDAIYVGMTIGSLSKRWGEHKTAAKIEQLGSTSICSLMKQHGVDQFKIMLIKEYNVIDKQHLRVYETLWINKLRCVNKLVSFNPMPKIQQKRAYNIRSKDKSHEYYEKNKELIRVKSKMHREANKDVMKEKSKAYRAANRESIKVKKAERFECDCGGTWTKGHGFKRHESTKLHQNWVKASSGTPL